MARCRTQRLNDRSSFERGNITQARFIGLETNTRASDLANDTSSDIPPTTQANSCISEIGPPKATVCLSPLLDSSPPLCWTEEFALSFSAHSRRAASPSDSWALTGRVVHNRNIVKMPASNRLLIIRSVRGGYRHRGYGTRSRTVWHLLMKLQTI